MMIEAFMSNPFVVVAWWLLVIAGISVVLYVLLAGGVKPLMDKGEACQKAGGVLTRSAQCVKEIDLEGVG